VTGGRSVCRALPRERSRVGAAGCAGLGVPFPSGPYGDYAPAWSPDGLEIAFSGLRTDGGIGYVLYVTDL
jgi:hypothetical protein